MLSPLEQISDIVNQITADFLNSLKLSTISILFTDSTYSSMFKDHLLGLDTDEIYYGVAVDQLLHRIELGQ